ncbi:FHA domain-containing protein [Spirochaetia bacterium 38H-sp]|uniref:FHA domain-containing protein n=1 Tax=Rarispira pelagica TaxID=3141764 RepID=A0ABU9UBL1_9SPIR
MQDDTIMGSSPIGKRLESTGKKEKTYCLVFGNKNLPIVGKITIGRAPDNDVVIDNKLASRYHAFIQKIKNICYIKDLSSTNGTYVNGKKIPTDKYVRLSPGDEVTIGKTSLIVR